VGALKEGVGTVAFSVAFILILRRKVISVLVTRFDNICNNFIRLTQFKPHEFRKRRTRPSRIRSFSAAAQRTFRACSRDEAAHAVACAAEASGARSIRTQRWRLPRLWLVHDSGR
jgi:hypothetical protein